MRADKISLVAKKDPLICAFASRYLKIHRENHFILVASRKMRELARLLLEIKKIKPTIKGLFETLKPDNYDILVSATKAASRFDKDSKTYQAPTFALNMGTTLKQCCDIALVYSFKKSDYLASTYSATQEADLKTLIQLINGNWKFDVSNQASSDLNINKWNKVTLVPLATDLKLLKDYLIKQADDALYKLQENSSDEKSYTTLIETIYCRIILLNRRRPGELQRLLVNTYKSIIHHENDELLMSSFKRIVIRGKREMGVPILISKDVQEHLNIVLRCRSKILKMSNIYLFANPKSSKPIVGYKALRKHASPCGAKNPDALTCTRLRKHLATLTQLFNMSENDMEQLASFMGHTLGIHRQSYRLPDDIYQTSRISKLLILMENGEAGHFKGKSLDEIEINLEENLMDMSDKPKSKENEHGNENWEATEKQNDETHLDTSNAQDLLENSEKSKLDSDSIQKPKIRKLVPWTTEQKNLVMNFF
ncbi:uncharacterized protein LOC132699597 [Cylas formicarius]|uniref:uncharacterized protein LOC132699597 n=1 Tax=Cylas formicarius TaxID=197179 RepID=UPI0029588C84|nr:uncharacterized protein LOC132699597 [Cylas formicarius]